MDLITNFIQNNGKTYKQGSDTHLELRRNYVGCSELYKAVGTISMVKNVIKGKICPQPLNILPVTHGLHFEDNCEEYVKHILNNTTIYKAPGSILNPNIPNIACSPDGLGYLNISAFDKYKRVKKGIEYVSISNSSNIREELLNAFSSTSDTKQMEPCLFEYKSPFSRKLKDGYISLDYEYQIQGGMQVLDICNYACFFEGVFKLCSLGQLFCTWCYDMNYTLYECLEEANELAKGIKLYYLKPEFFNKSNVLDKLLRLLDDFNNPLYEMFGVDFGIHDYFKSFFVGLNESMFYTVNLPIYYRVDKATFVNDKGETLDKEHICIMLSEYAQESGYLGYACWKLYDYQIIIEKRKNIITEKELSRCKSIMNCIQQIDDPAQIDFLHLSGSDVIL